jgi:beta-glucosidase
MKTEHVKGLQTDTGSGLPETFLWGVATSGYQSEGGYNGPGQPQNNWSRSEAKGAVMNTGKAAEFWTRYEEDFQTCQGMGLNSFRLGLEWARIQPSNSHQPESAPPFDFAALDAYAKRLAACRDQGLEPVVTLHHFTHPAWLGADAWLQASTIDLFAAYVCTTVTYINRRLTDHYHQPPLRWFITINEPNMLVLNTYISRQFPAGPLHGPQRVLQAYNHLLAAHVRAYNSIHDLYEHEGWPQPQVSLNTYSSDLYWSDKVLWDLLSLRERQVVPTQLHEYIYDQARRFESAMAAAHLPFRHDLPYQVGRLAHWISNWFGYRSFHSQHLNLYLRELEVSPRDCIFDYVAIDYYDPFLAHSFRLPTFSDFEFQTRGLPSWLMSGIISKWWDWRSLPEGLHFFCTYYAQDFAPRPVLIAENGMAMRRRPDNSIASHRPDQLLRSEFLQVHVQQVLRLLSESVPIAGYMHWSLMDNYEWGSYTPRFGLFSIDFAAGTNRLVEDHLGDRPSETYAHLIREARFPSESERIPNDL